MGHKAVVIFDLDNIHTMKSDPAEFVRRLELAILSHRRTGGSVSMGGCTIANAVWSGHTDLSPVLKIVDFTAENVTYDEPQILQPTYWEVTEHGRTYVLSAAEFAKRSFDCASFKPLYN